MLKILYEVWDTFKEIIFKNKTNIIDLDNRQANNEDDLKNEIARASLAEHNLDNKKIDKDHSATLTEQNVIGYDEFGKMILIPKSKFNANGYSYKGEVDTPDNLPPDEFNQVGDQYRVTSEHGVYSWNGNRWFFYLADGNSFDITQFTNVKIIP